LYGERVVADRLMDLTADGYAVFHDVPCLGGGGPFNLDHVVVGRGGVGVVETKTYRKRAGVNGESHKVSYDGQKLVWPDGTTTHELEQVTRNAEWLHKELKKHLNLDVPVRAALTMPGWYVKSAHSPKDPVLVANTKLLPDYIPERFQGTLTREQEDLVRRHLRGLCETVSFGDMSV
ncbi:MAG TPA: nuclease-related domain-containing protein, partial [Prosthecobacter sp.]|nr:nuclease-related domain-containing protein [Prosthecobacter sp.]